MAENTTSPLRTRQATPCGSASPSSPVGGAEERPCPLDGVARLGRWLALLLVALAVLAGVAS